MVLLAEYEKSQQQLQELMKKLQEIQEQNSTLQNENQSLKKNISALIKTARVEINRKDEEINTLQRRLSETPVYQKTYTRTYFPGSTHHTKYTEGSKSKNKSRDLLPENSRKMDSRTKQALPKEVPHSYPPREAENKKCNSEKGGVPYIPRSDPEQLYNDGTHARLTKGDSSCDKEKEKKETKYNDHHSRENDYKYKAKVHQNPGSTADGILDTHGKLQANLEKTVRNGLLKDNKDLNMKYSPCTETRTDKIPSAKEKQLTPTDRLLPKTGHCSDDRSKKSQNINQKDLNTQSKEESNTAQKSRQSDRYLEQQKTAMFSIPPEKNVVVRSPQKLSKSCVEEKKTKDNDCRRNKGGNNHGIHEGRFSESSPPVSNREQKHGHSKEESKKCEHMHFKSDRHRTEEKRKNESNCQREGKSSQNGRGDSKETSQKTARKVIKSKDRSKEEEEKSLPSEKIDKLVDDTEEHKSTKVGRVDEHSKNKDLKLSFMQKLNLTLSPAKKQTDKSIAKSTNVCDRENPSQKVLLAPSEEKRENEDRHSTSFVPAEPINTHTTKQAKAPLLHIQDNPVQTSMERIACVSDVKMQVENEDLAKALSMELCKRTSFPLDTAGECDLAHHEKLDAKTEREKADKMCVVPSPASLMDPDSSFNDLETISSVDFDSFSVIDEIHGSDSDSLMDEGETSNSMNNKMLVCPEKEAKPEPYTDLGDKGEMTTDDVLMVNQGTHNLKPYFPEDGNNLESLHNQELNLTSQSRDTNPVSADDDNSILSIDLNQMRCIPKAISPLNSPIRPLAKALRMESPYNGPVKSCNTDLIPEGTVAYPGRNQSSELNKENEKPLCTDHHELEVSRLNMSSDELEEGEIVSDVDEPKTEQNSVKSKKSKRKPSPDRSNLAKSTCHHKAKLTPSGKDAGKLVPGEKGKEKFHSGTIMSSKEVKKTVSIDYLERIVKITIKPTTVHEFMHMLRAIRKQIRKNYMKFKIQFPVQHFHRIIDSAVVNFTSLVKYLDFSKMSKSSEALKMKLCEVIESKLNQIKKNSIIEHLFKQQQSDMKKKLWKLVDEQLDYLFDKIKKILLKMCNLVNFGNESNETKVDKRMKEKPKSLVSHKNDRQKSKKPALTTRIQKHDDCVLPKTIIGNQMSKRGYHDTNRMDTHNTAAKCKHSYTNNAKHSQTEAEPFRQKSMQDTTLKDGKSAKEESHMIGDPHKSDVSCGPLTEQQMSGLTFNLVNDAQMGEMFKSLLQGIDLSEKNVDFTDENQWEFRTPQKHTVEGHICEDDPAYEAEQSVQKETQLESRVLDAIKWPVVSPERDSSFLARLQVPIDPAVLDESCMFEIPNSPALKKSEACISEKPKSLVSSILLEDLAVSLTIPSPLKSDAHLSFLKPDVLGSVPEDVLNAHFSEDAHLDEEDASEQDIHLALESDNSSSKSSGSSTWTDVSAAPGFQYCPSLPMQAVIMEKSNDHFIVKIRRAAPSTSPILDQAILADGSLTSLTERGNHDITPEEKTYTLSSKSMPLEGVATSKDNVNITDLGGKAHIGKEQVPNSEECVMEVSKYLENDQEPTHSKFQQDPHPHASDDAPESIESFFSSAKQKQPCDMPEFPQERYSNTGQSLGPDLPGLHRVLCKDACSEEASDLQDPPKKLEESFLSLKESSIKTSQGKDIPEVFKLPQTQTLKLSPKSDVPCAKEQCSSFNSESVPLVEGLSSESHFDICMEVTEETPMENEVDSWDLTIQSALNTRKESLYKDQREQKIKTENYCEADHPSEHVEAVRSLTDQPDKSVADEDFEMKTAPNTHDQECNISLKESKKRKNETEVTASTKRHRTETNDSTCKKSGKSSKKSKDTNSESISASHKKTTSVSGKDALLSTSSVSPSNLCAKNIIKKKGEIVISWTRNDDREILLECQKKGPLGKTFASVAARLNKSQTQVEERFKQLLKLFKMSNCS
ncbi:CASP8-associated protein 2 isoform X2 [Sceloporus undulatus]|uniref:CASP8-associated protein 2 isoform X2 n=1 Tax=Sceloporus undulatus TaxID=8520 RepID=UPI001C4AD627|nr:CASP8-associated protein 2 isoform X2 [Sceloporus undulatus]